MDLEFHKSECVDSGAVEMPIRGKDFFPGPFMVMVAVLAENNERAAIAP